MGNIPSKTILLGPLLKSVSRSFYLTLRILPAGMREPIGLAYLLGRAADTIADTSLIPPEHRLDLLFLFRDRINSDGDHGELTQIVREIADQQIQPDERVLFESLDQAFRVLSQMDAPDEKAVREIASTLTEGMEFDLRTFPDEYSGQIVALQEFKELDWYTYMVAGCVGEFWTKMTYAHMPGTFRASSETMLELGIRFGKALQMTNVLRDCGKDLRIGRCYLPSAMLDPLNLSPQDLLLPASSLRARPLLYELVQKALDHFRCAAEYTLAMSRTSVRLRLACLWPILIGLDTLLLLVNNDDWLDPAKVSKVRRSDVYRILLSSLPLLASDRLLRIWLQRKMEKIEARTR